MIIFKTTIKRHTDMAEERFTSKYDGTTQDNLLGFAENAKKATTVDGAETVNVQGFTLPRISDISGFVAVNNAGNAIGFMSKEQVASVLGGLIGTVTANKAGLMPAGLYMYSNAVINKNQSLKLSPVNGVMFIRNTYSYGGYVMYIATFTEVKVVCNPAGYDIGIDVKVTNLETREITISTLSEANRQIQVIYQNLPY